MGVKKLEQEAAEAVAKSVVKEGEALAVGLEAEARTGMPVKNQKAIADAAKAHDVVIDVRGTNPEAPRRLAEGNLPKPEALKAKSINQLDTHLGFRREDVGLVGYMEPKPPVKGEVPPELWEQVQKRYADRLAEFKDLAPEMQNLGRPVGARDQFAAVGFDKQVTVDANGVIRTVEGDGKPATGVTGDHDIFQITNPNGTPVSPQKYNEVMTDLVQQGAGVEHGAHMAWDVPNKPASSAYKDPTKGFQGIADKHMPGAKAGRPVPVRPRRVDHAGPRGPGEGHARIRPRRRQGQQGRRGAGHRQDRPGDRPALGGGAHHQGCSSAPSVPPVSSSASSAAMSSSESVEVEDLRVLLDALAVGRLRDARSRSRCDAPAQQDLRRRAPDALGDLADARGRRGGGRCRAGCRPRARRRARSHASSSARRYSNGLNWTWLTTGGLSATASSSSSSRDAEVRDADRARVAALRGRAPSRATPRSGRPGASG